MAKLKPYAFLIDPKQHALLRALHDRDGIAQGEAIRRALATYLKKARIRLPRKKKRR